MNKTATEVTLRLTLDVTYADSEGQDDKDGVETLGTELLEALVRTAMNRGMVTGDTHLEVEGHSMRIDRVDPEPPSIFSDSQILTWAENEEIDFKTWTMPASHRLHLVRFARRVQAFERGRCAELCEMSLPAIKLLAGEMTAQESRTVLAVLKSRAAAIRSRGPVDTVPA